MFVNKIEFNKVFSYILTNLIRPYGILNIREKDINIIINLFPFANGLTRIIWGFLCDYFGYKVVYLFQIILGMKNNFNIIV